MRIWIDLNNAPHPLLFAPVARILAADGHELILSARDHAETVALARRTWPEVAVIGGASPRGRARKARTVALRVVALRRWARDRRPDVALSHNSYPQLLAARSLGIPAVTAMDYEHQPANHLAFRLAGTVLLPEVMPSRAVRRQGARGGKVIRYPGLKEELYLGDFAPDPAVLERAGLPRRPPVLVVLRTPPARALYHPAGHPLFERVLVALGERAEVGCIVLARFPEQAEAIRALGAPNLVVPAAALETRALLYAADAMIGAGGTMTREAALLGIPTWTVFSGRPAAVDGWLEGEGRLRRLEHPGQLAALGPRRCEPLSPPALRARAQAIAEVFVTAAIRAGTRRETRRAGR